MWAPYTLDIPRRLQESYNEPRLRCSSPSIPSPGQPFSGPTARQRRAGQVPRREVETHRATADRAPRGAPQPRSAPMAAAPAPRCARPHPTPPRRSPAAPRGAYPMAASGAGHRRCRAGRVPGALLAAPRLAAPAAPQPRGGGGDAALGCPRRSAQARGSRRRLAAAEPSRAGPPALYGAPPAGRARMAGGPAGRPQAAAPAPERACVRRRLGVRTGPQQRVGGRADGRRSPFSARGWRQLRRFSPGGARPPSARRASEAERDGAGGARRAPRRRSP